MGGLNLGTPKEKEQRIPKGPWSFVFLFPGTGTQASLPGVGTSHPMTVCLKAGVFGYDGIVVLCGTFSNLWALQPTFCVDVLTQQNSGLNLPPTALGWIRILLKHIIVEVTTTVLYTIVHLSWCVGMPMSFHCFGHAWIYVHLNIPAISNSKCSPCPLNGIYIVYLCPSYIFQIYKYELHCAYCPMTTAEAMKIIRYSSPGSTKKINLTELRGDADDCQQSHDNCGLFGLTNPPCVENKLPVKQNPWPKKVPMPKSFFFGRIPQTKRKHMCQ